MINLDYIAAKYGLRIVTDAEDTRQLENIINAALNILHLQGIYALFLWLHAKEERYCLGRNLDELLRDNHIPFCSGTLLFLQDEPLNALNNVKDQMTKDLKKMFFLQDIIEQTLIYARHGAKAA